MPICDPMFLMTFAIFACVFWIAPGTQLRAVMTLVASYLYYLTFPRYCMLFLLLVTLVAYLGGLAIQRVRGRRWSWLVVSCALAVCLAPMIVGKYVAMSDHVGDPHFAYPVGLSFYTFVAVAYLSDVALDVIDAEVRPLKVALACAFFPTVAMGPLLRTTFFGQLEFTRKPDRSRILRGVCEMLVGASLKLWIADTLAIGADAVYGDLRAAPAIEQFMGCVVEAFQIYADWQGYSLIAIGAARVLGVDFPANFRQPYLAPDIGEFWRSWNTSFINWFRDYVFTPIRLQFSLQSPWAIPSATFATFFLLGVWHTKGGWGYVVYGIVNALLLISSQLTLPIRDRFWSAVGVPSAVLVPWRIVSTFVVVALTVPLVRAASLTEAIEIYRHLFSEEMIGNLRALFSDSASLFPHVELRIAVPLIALLIVMDVATKAGGKSFPEAFSWPVQIAACIVCLAAISIHFALGFPVTPFVYYRF